MGREEARPVLHVGRYGHGEGGALALGTGIIRAHMRVVGWLQACLIRM